MAEWAGDGHAQLVPRQSLHYNARIPEPEECMPVWELIKSGGWLMLPIIACSIGAVAIAIERWWTLDYRKVVPRNTLAELWDWIRKNELSSERMRELKLSSPLGRILAAGISNSHHGREVMKESIQEAASHVIHDLERYLNTLGTIAAITPLLGLLGTVVGMIQVFSDVMLHGTGNAELLAGGISKALITTAAGLSVAIPALIVHRHFLRRVDTIGVGLEQEASKLGDAMHGARRGEVKGSGAR